MSLSEKKLSQISIDARNSLLESKYSNHTNVLHAEFLERIVLREDAGCSEESARSQVSFALDKMRQLKAVDKFYIAGAFAGYRASDDVPRKLGPDSDPWAWTE